MFNSIKTIRDLRGYTQEDASVVIAISGRSDCLKKGNHIKSSLEEVKKLSEILLVETEVFFRNKLTVMVS